ncbi:MAG: DUF5916 domain-containing protein, partial [Patescibacteria group bacterium]|nr:DUF5916 domain-containing protein [Patescibacteria group bacterium]
KENNGGVWGVNFMRYIRRKQERAYWIPIPRELGRMGAWRASLFGQIEGVKPHYSGLGLEIKPFFVGGMTRQYRPLSLNRQSNQGLDLRYGFTPNIRGDFSYNTDFAQVESDQEVVNLTRFSLYYPEKREFFLENAGLFGLAGGGSQGREYSSLQYFYSRRIGIEGGRPIPIIGAAKLSGRLGSYTIGIMNIQAQKKKFFNDDAEYFDLPNENFTAIRVKKDVFKQSSFGGMVLNKQGSSDMYNRLAAVDGLLKLGTWFTVEGNLAKTFTPAITKKDYAGQFQMNIQKKSVSWRASYLRIDPHFNPEMGYVRRENIRQYRSSLFVTKWFNNKLLRDISVSGYGGYTTDDTNDFLLNNGGGMLMINLASGDEIWARFGRESERIYESFDIRNAHIMPGIYPSWFRSVSFFTNESRNLSGGIAFENGDFWGGKSNEVMIANGVRPISNLSVEVMYFFNRISHPTDSFNSNVLSNRITYAFTPDLFAKSYVQWNELDKRISVNFLMNYQYRPGSDLYLVYNEIYDSDGELIGLGIKNRVLLLKLTYLLRV